MNNCKNLTLSGLEPFELKSNINFVNVGERTNVTGSRKFARLITNGDYESATEIARQQALGGANIIDVTKMEKGDNIIFGSTVHLVNLENNEKKIYKIVGKDEADILKNYIYFKSPIGKALIGKRKNDLVTVKTPAGEKNFEITEVKYI